MCTDRLVPHIIGIILGPAALFGGVLLFSRAGAVSASGMRAVFGYIPDGTPAHPYHNTWGYSWGYSWGGGRPTVPMPPFYRYYGCFTIFFALWTIGISAYGLWTNATCSPDHDIFLGYVQATDATTAILLWSVRAC